MLRTLTIGIAAVAALTAMPLRAFVTPEGTNYHSGIVQVSAGVTHTCALMADFHASCWGSGGAALGITPLPVPGLDGAIQIASGNNFACALLLDHTVSCWGDNSYGQLGDGTHTARPNDPRPVKWGSLMFGNVKSIAVGNSHVCAVKGESEGNTVWCWGSNTAGQLGNYTVPHVDFRQPIQVVIQGDDAHPDAYLNGVEMVSAGNAHTCALFSGSRTIACWGWNNFRQIGNVDATAEIVESPVGVKVYDDKGMLVDFVSAGGLSTGGFHACVLDRDSDPTLDYRAACWGSDDHGQVGNPIGTTAIPAVVGYDYWSGSNHVIVRFNRFSKLSLGNETSCAIGSKKIWCWGDNSFGQLGASSAGSSNEIPQEVQHPGFEWTALSDLSVGAQHSCALIDDTIFCWGRNDSGQLGIGSTSSGTHYEPDAAKVDPPIFTDNLDGN